MIGYYVHHHGAGHRTRACAIAAALGAPVTGLSSLPRPADWAGDWVQLPRDDEPAPVAADDVTAGGALHWAPLRHAGYAARMAALAAWVERARPDLMVVDVSVEVTLLARLLGVPAAVVAMRGRRDDPPHVAAYDVAAVLVAAWPASFPESWWPQRWQAKTAHVGAVSRFDGWASPGVGEARDAGRAAGPERPHRGLLLWGTGGERGPDLARLRAATPGWTWERPEGAGADEVWAALARADVVVTHAGQNAVAEVAAARRPAVVVADPRPFGEQTHTVDAVARAGLGVGLRAWPEASAWPRLLQQAQAVGGGGWAAWNDGGGAARAAAAIRAVAPGGARP